MNRSRIAGVLALLVFSLSVLAGCNTMQGVGQDVEQAGEEIEESAS